MGILISRILAEPRCKLVNQRQEVYHGGDAEWNGRAVSNQQGPLRVLCLQQDVQATWLIKLGKQRAGASLPLPGVQAAHDPHGSVLQVPPRRSVKAWVQVEAAYLGGERFD